MFSKPLSAALLLLSVLSSASAHAIITPALGVSGTPARSDVTKPSTKAPCGAGVNVAQAIPGSQAVTANGNSFTVTVTNFNGGKDGSTEITDALVDATGTGSFTAGTAATITTNGVAAPKTTGSVQVSGTLPAGTTCTGGNDGASCLVSFTTAGGFGNCVLVSQGSGAAGAGNAAANATAADTAAVDTAAANATATDAAAAAATAATGTTTTTGKKNRKGGKKAAAAAAAAASSSAAAAAAAADATATAAAAAAATDATVAAVDTAADATATAVATAADATATVVATAADATATAVDTAADASATGALTAVAKGKHAKAAGSRLARGLKLRQELGDQLKIRRDTSWLWAH